MQKWNATGMQEKAQGKQYGSREALDGRHLQEDVVLRGALGSLGSPAFVCSFPSSSHSVRSGHVCVPLKGVGLEIRESCVGERACSPKVAL